MKRLAIGFAGFCALCAAAAPELSFQPANPTPVDTIQVVVTESTPNCPVVTPDDISYVSGRIVIRLYYIGDCEFGPFSQARVTLGRLPQGTYPIDLRFGAPPDRPLADSADLVVASPASASIPWDSFAGLYTTNVSGEGVSVEQFGTTAFVALFTYDPNGAPTWTYMPAARWTLGPGGVYRFAGSVHTAHRASQSGAGNFAETVVGEGFFSTSGENGSLQMTVNGATLTRSLRRFRF